MAPPLLFLRDILLGYGGAPLLDRANMAVMQDDRIALIGRNGTGKSTLLKLLSSEVDPDSGERFLQPGTSVAWLPQEPDLTTYPTVEAYIAGGLTGVAKDETYRVTALAADLDIDPQASTAHLSGGEQRRAALARTLIADADIILLDEPTNHLDLPTIQWLEQTLAGYPGAVIVISHDRAFLRRVSRTVLWLDRGQLRRMDGPFDKFESWSEALLQREAEARAKRDKLIAQETVWSHAGITARRRRNEGRMQRLRTLRWERSEEISRLGRVSMGTSDVPLSGKLVIDAVDIAKSYDNRTIVREFSLRVLRGDRVGIIGANGAGKTTLVKMLTGALTPDRGSVRLGANLDMVVLDQNRSMLSSDKSLQDILAPGGGDQVLVNGKPRHVASYMRDFLFGDGQLKSPVASLSGGERNRLLLAWAFARPSNLLVLDEPTNDLDMDTLDLLQEVLADYAGTLILVSHDRDFLDRVVTSTVAMEGNGEAVEYAGGFSDYVAQRPPQETSKPAPKKQSAKKSPAAKPPPTSAKRKLTFKEQRNLVEFPKKLERLQAEVAELENFLGDPQNFQKKPEAFQTSADRLTAAKSELAATEDDWLELEMLREEIEGGA